MERTGEQSVSSVAILKKTIRLPKQWDLCNCVSVSPWLLIFLHILWVHVKEKNNSGHLRKEGVALWHAGFGGKEGQTGADRGSRITNYQSRGITHSLPYEGVGRFKKGKSKLMKMKDDLFSCICLFVILETKRLIWSIKIPKEILLSQVQHQRAEGFYVKTGFLELQRGRAANWR